MCIIFNVPQDRVEPTSTLLLNVPVETARGEIQQHQLIYLNKIESGPTYTEANWLSPEVVKLLNDHAPSRLARPARPARPALMVVPIPNKHGMAEADFCLFNVPNSAAVSLRAELDDMNKPYTPPPPPKPHYGDRFSVSMESWCAKDCGVREILTVQRVGSYEIAVAPSLADLETRAPWHALGFGSAEAEHVEAILADMRQKYAAGFAFVIAKATEAAADIDGGFGLIYRDAEAFFPTSHEVTRSGRAHMDVDCIGLGVVIRPDSIGTDANPPARFTLTNARTQGWPSSSTLHMDRAAADNGATCILRGEDGQTPTLPGRFSHLLAMLAALPRQGAPGELHGRKRFRHCPVRLATSLRLSGNHPNGDLKGRPATATDDAAVARLLADFDAWHEMRGGTVNLYRSTLEPDPGSKLDLALALLAQELACTPAGASAERETEVPAFHLNLDLVGVTLDDAAYASKDGPGTPSAWLPTPLSSDGGHGHDCAEDADIAARRTRRTRQLLDHKFEQDTKGTTYLRISARAGPWQSLECRTVGGELPQAVVSGGGSKDSKDPRRIVVANYSWPSSGGSGYGFDVQTWLRTDDWFIGRDGWLHISNRDRLPPGYYGEDADDRAVFGPYGMNPRTMAITWPQPRKLEILDDDLHPAAEPEHQVERRLLLDLAGPFWGSLVVEREDHTVRIVGRNRLPPDYYDELMSGIVA